MLSLRKRSLAQLFATFPPGARLLDVGAGTGTEAIALAREGRHVVAIDPSAEMLARVREKAARACVELPTMQLAARDVAKAAADAPFDGAYSSFGALNGEAELAPVSDGLASVVRPGGALVLGVLNRWPIATLACQAVALRPRRAIERMRGRATWRADPKAPSMDVRYHSLRALRRAFAPAFEMESALALALLLPPPHAWRVARRTPRLLAALERGDEALASKPGLRALGDHHLITLRRRAV